MNEEKLKEAHDYLTGLTYEEFMELIGPLSKTAKEALYRGLLNKMKSDLQEELTQLEAEKTKQDSRIAKTQAKINEINNELA